MESTTGAELVKNSSGQTIGDNWPGHEAEDITYLRFAFGGELGALQAGRSLDTGIVRTLWLAPDEIRASASRHRSPLIVRCMEDHLRGQRFPLEPIHTDASVFSLQKK